MRFFSKVLSALLLASLAAYAASPQSRRPVVVGYFPQWQLYSDKPFTVKALVDNGSAALLDQINYAQGFVKDGHCSVADPNADLNTVYTAQNSVSGVADNPSLPFRGYFHQMKELKQRYPKLKLLISLEGRAQDFAFDAQPENRKAFIESCMDVFIRGRFAPGVNEPGLFDGIDIDWESPKQEDARNFEDLLREFRAALDDERKRLKLTIAVGHSPRMLGGSNMKVIAPLVDQVGVMNYDYAGPWMQRSGFIAPLFNSPDGRGNSIDRGMADYIEAGVPAHKLLMGVPFYGYAWTVPEGDRHGLFQSGRGVRGDHPYSEIQSMKGKYVLYRDEASHAPWLYDGETFWTYEDPASLRYKVTYAAKRGLGGMMIWELSGDTGDALMLRTLHSTLSHPVKWYKVQTRGMGGATDLPSTIKTRNSQ